MPSGSTRRYVGTGLVAALVAGVLAMAAASPQDPQQQRPTFRVGSSFVRVDVYPSKDGKAVTDLAANEFEILEDGVAQRIESFEFVAIPAGAPDTAKTETSSQRESLQAAANPRNRVFVLFIDTRHIDIRVARLNEALIRMLDRVLGPDDLIGVMTPKMSASQIVLGRKTRMIEDSLRSNSAFIQQFLENNDPTAEPYAQCGDQDMLARGRERATLEALQDLVRYLKTIREERKAILTITGGWPLYREDRALLERGRNSGVDKPYVGPDGRITTGRDPRSNTIGLPSQGQCSADRLRLATIDDEKFFRDLLDEANGANASFYPIDPGGLDIFNEGIKEARDVATSITARRHRVDVLKTLAENTDGIAVVDNNNLDAGLRRISDDLASYYLLGYSSTNTKMDGAYRALKVRVTRPGVTVRARRGYRGPTTAEMTSATTAANAMTAEARSVTAAIGLLGAPRGDLPFRINAATMGGSSRALWVAGELVSQPGRPDSFAKGGTAVIDATIGAASFSAEVTLKPGERTFVTQVPISGDGSGEISVRARVTPLDGSLPYTDMVRISSAAATEGAQPLFMRRGVTTGNRWVPTADLRFSRTERVRLEWPVAPDESLKAVRVLDRAGQPLHVTATIGGVAAGLDVKGQPSGQTWATTELTLAPLSTADYAVEVEIAKGQSTRKAIVGLRVIR
jgi:VWFA-related protein